MGARVMEAAMATADGARVAQLEAAMAIADASRPAESDFAASALVSFGQTTKLGEFFSLPNGVSLLSQETSLL